MNNADYPFIGRQATCKQTANSVVFKNKGYGNELKVSNNRLKELVSNYPISVGMYVSDSIQTYSYKGGVFTEEFLKCSTASATNHAITLVGYGSASG